jgi:hypothetical protein
MGKIKKIYQAGAKFIKNHKPLMRKIDSAVDKYSKRAMALGELADAAAPATGAFAPIVAGAGTALMTGGAIAQGARQIARNAPGWYNKNKNRINKIKNTVSTVRNLVTGAEPPSAPTFY